LAQGRVFIPFPACCARSLPAVPLPSILPKQFACAAESCFGFF
jgi:hypothetical protein